MKNAPPPPPPRKQVTSALILLVYELIFLLKPLAYEIKLDILPPEFEFEPLIILEEILFPVYILGAQSIAANSQ